METSVYANIATTEYTRPMEPGPYENHGPGYKTASIADANAMHKEERRIYDLDENVNATIKQEIIVSVEETYLTTKNSGT